MKQILYILAVVLTAGLSARTQAADQPVAIALFDFESKDEAVRDLGPKIAAIITARLSVDDRLMTVERAEIDKALGEIEMGMSGTIDPGSAAKVGHLTGAKVLVTGRVFLVQRDTFIVAKIIGTETSRVYGEMVSGPATGSLSDLATDLAKKIAETVIGKTDDLLAKVEKPEDRIARLKALIKADKLPVVDVKISERHFGGQTHDPAAETEIAFILQQCGFAVSDSKTQAKPDVEIEGEAISELAMRKGNLVSCKGRVEIKVRDKATGKVLLVDRQVAVAVDLSEQMAAKAALAKAAQELADRIVPVIGK